MMTILKQIALGALLAITTAHTATAAIPLPSGAQELWIYNPAYSCDLDDRSDICRFGPYRFNDKETCPPDNSSCWLVPVDVTAVTTPDTHARYCDAIDVGGCRPPRPTGPWPHWARATAPATNGVESWLVAGNNEVSCTVDSGPEGNSTSCTYKYTW